MTKIILLIAAVACLTSCTINSEDVTSGNNTVVLIDISKSIKLEVLEWYIQSIEKNICENLNQYDKITILPIDGASQTASKPLLEINLFDYRNEWNVMGLNANETKKLKKEAFKKFIHLKIEELKAAIIEARKYRLDAGNTTDILGALVVAQDKFDSDYKNTIVIFSDMEQYADKCKMCDNGKASVWLSEISDIIYPQISKFSIAIITGEQLAMPKTYYNEIKAFWNEFFLNQGVKNISYKGADASELKKFYLANN